MNTYRYRDPGVRAGHLPGHAGLGPARVLWLRLQAPSAIWDKYPGLTAGEFPFRPDRVEKEVFKSSLASIGKAAALFGWAPKVTLEEGLKGVFEYAQRQLALSDAAAAAAAAAGGAAAVAS